MRKWQRKEGNEAEEELKEVDKGGGQRRGVEKRGTMPIKREKTAAMFPSSLLAEVSVTSSGPPGSPWKQKKKKKINMLA